MKEVKNNIKFIPDQDQIPGYKFPDYSVFFQTDTIKDIKDFCYSDKILSEQQNFEFCPNSKIPDKSRSGLNNMC